MNKYGLLRRASPTAGFSSLLFVSLVSCSAALPTHNTKQRRDIFFGTPATAEIINFISKSIVQPHKSNYMLWKKKKEEAVEESIRYTCRGINYLEIIELNGESLDSSKEELFEYFEKQQKVYTKEEIAIITSKLGFDIWNSFIWIDARFANKGTMDVRVLKRWLGVNDITKEPEFLAEINTVLPKYLNHHEFYNRVQIEKISQIVGFSVYDRSNWESFTQITLKIPEYNQTIVYYQKTKK